MLFTGEEHYWNAKRAVRVSGDICAERWFRFGWSSRDGGHNGGCCP